ncbi:Hypothetical_protein [Hexamita inflata]|uniref:Hypothetical_protein n=1 Tax=Hexamita inflata TaxID=28002 RepID=A0AA86P5L0_9EUKA|nr:Hypothetical protein HINF_LOCUS19693 [Hexamita inflata]
MVNKFVSVYMDIITAICLALLVLSSLIVIFSYTYAISVDYYFKVLFLIICCVFQIISPWVKFAQKYFKFMTSPFWRAGFVFMLGMFQFPSFDAVAWKLGAFIFQNVCAIAVMMAGINYLLIAIVDCQRKNTLELLYNQVTIVLNNNELTNSLILLNLMLFYSWLFWRSQFSNVINWW